jgi:hypothetical protein
MVIARMTGSPRSLALALLYACAMALIAFGSNGQVVAPSEFDLRNPHSRTCTISQTYHATQFLYAYCAAAA